MGSSPIPGWAFFMEKAETLLNTIDFAIEVGLWLRLLRLKLQVPDDFDKDCKVQSILLRCNEIMRKQIIRIRQPACKKYECCYQLDDLL